MNRILSHIPSNQSVTGIHTTLHNFTWKITGETEKKISWYYTFSINVKNYIGNLIAISRLCI